MQLLRKILWPVSLLYALGVYLRNLTYELGLRPIAKFNTPTICVGNLSVGGTGKTPMIEWLIRNTKNSDHLAVLSRGYKRSSIGFVLANANSTAEDIGDEPLQIYRKFPSITMAVDANRRRAMSYLDKQLQPEIVLLDDAFQHRKLQASFSILLTTFDLPYYKDWYLPAGTLRDLKSQANRANIIVVTKCPEDLDTSAMRHIRERLRPKSHQKVLFATLEYSEDLHGTIDFKKLEELAGKDVTLVTGIARAEPLVNYLLDRGLKVNHLRYRDHHSFTKRELDTLASEDLVLTTEKDYVRALHGLTRVAYLEIRHRFLGEGKTELLDALKILKS